MTVPFEKIPSQEDVERASKLVINNTETRHEEEPYFRSKIETLYKEEKEEKKPKQATHLDPGTEKFLRHISEIKEFLPLREIYQDLGLSAYSGNKLKNTLIEKEIITETETDLGKAKRKSKVLSLTSKGRELLGLAPLSGKGGPFHQNLQDVIAEYAARNGYEASVEEQTSQGIQVDVGLTKNGEKTAVEIAVTTRPEQIYKNIELARKGGYQRIIMLFTSAEILENTKKLMDKSMSLEDRQGIILALVTDYKVVI